jgi:biotin operon repressor
LRSRLDVVATAARLLSLLAMLSTRPHWSAGELAARLEVTERTMRRDITQLRDIGYPVEATPGVHGGYQLGAGPPAAARRRGSGDGDRTRRRRRGRLVGLGDVGHRRPDQARSSRLQREHAG